MPFLCNKVLHLLRNDYDPYNPSDEGQSALTPPTTVLQRLVLWLFATVKEKRFSPHFPRLPLPLKT